jgi:hypothetical protein
VYRCERAAFQLDWPASNPETTAHGKYSSEPYARSQLRLFTQVKQSLRALTLILLGFNNGRAGRMAPVRAHTAHCGAQLVRRRTS